MSFSKLIPEPALEWANAHRTELNDRGTTAISALIAMQQQNNNTSSADDDDDMSSINLPRSSALEFKLRRLKYIEMLSSGDRAGAIAYARLHFPPFVGSHEREVQSLMGAVMYVNGEDPRARLLVSPYGHLLDDSLWHDICDLFVKDACALLGLSVESPLSVAVNAGCKTLPGLLNIKQVISVTGTKTMFMYKRHNMGQYAYQELFKNLSIGYAATPGRRRMEQRQGRTAYRDRSWLGLSFPQHICVSDLAATNYRLQPTNETHLRPLYFSRCAEQTVVRTQAQMPLLSRRAKSK